jgi:Tfp pilus assembly protein PilV
MLALVILSTAIIGAAAAQAGAWRVVSGSRTDAQAWAALHQQVEELISLGFDNVASGSKTVSGHPIQWTVSGVDPKVVLVVTQRQVGPAVIADTIQILLREPAP